MAFALSTGVEKLRGVGASVAAKLKRLEIETIEDLLWHVPSGYEDFRNQVKVKNAALDTPLTLTGTITNVKSRRSWQRRKLVVTEALFSDDSGSLVLTWFGRFALRIPEHIPVHLTGTITFERGQRHIVNPAIERVGSAPRRAGKLVAWYPSTTGLTQDRLRSLVSQALSQTDITDYFDREFRDAYNLAPLDVAFRGIHEPHRERDLTEAKRRLAFDELFFLQLSRALARRHRDQEHGIKISGDRDDIVASLPYALTKDQKEAVASIAEDFESGHPMVRLVQGDVGSGKTAVAAVAAALTARAGFQTMYLAPTEVLAEQHYKTFAQLLGSLGRTAILTRSLAAAQGFEKRKDIIHALGKGEISIVIGTHALLQSPVVFSKLGLVVVDEQHRFGVMQRMTAQRKGQKQTPHLLSMTATPIPRTLELAFLGDLDVSTLTTMPRGRRRIETMVFQSTDRKRVEAALKRRLAKGEQVFVVCPLIDPSDTLGVRSATAEYDRLRREGLQKARIGLLHGRLSITEKQATIEAFRTHALDVLVATTVIEVGLDIPEASVMVIEAAERFGLAQLHQLRGRVGRAGQSGVCVLFTENASAEAKRRLQLFAKTNDGFALSELDLQLRGPGEWFGTRQSGIEEFRVANLADTRFVSEVQRAAHLLLDEDKDLSHHPFLLTHVHELLARDHHVS